MYRLLQLQHYFFLKLKHIFLLGFQTLFLTLLGAYGNADARGPEIRLAHCRYVAVTDRHLYLNDVVNRRILKITLDYEQQALVPLEK